MIFALLLIAHFKVLSIFDKLKPIRNITVKVTIDIADHLNQKRKRS